MDSLNPEDEQFAYGNDESPWMNSVPEPPPSHWGKVTSDRTQSPAYIKFLADARRKKEERDGRK